MERRGQLISSGRTSDVFAWGTDRAIKLFFGFMDRKEVAREFFNSTLVYSKLLSCPSDSAMPGLADFKIPKPIEIREVSSSIGIIFERISGVTMLENFTKMSANPLELATQLAQIHRNIHSKTSVELPSLKPILKIKIESIRDIRSSLRDFALTVLSELPDGMGVCHGDFHPGNVILAPDGSYVIDWLDAAIGDPLADVARTALLLVYGKSGNNEIAVEREEFLEAYLHEYFGDDEEKREEVNRWIVPIAAARLSENIPGERDVLIGLLTELSE